MTERELPAWLRPGAQVAIVSGRSDTVSFDVVAKIGKLHITLERSDEKFRVGSLEGITKRDAWTPRPKLVDPDSTQVKAILKRKRLTSARFRVSTRHTDWARAQDKDDEVEKIRALRGELEALEAMLTR